MTVSTRLFMFTRYIFFFNVTATTEIYTLSLHDALPICRGFGEVPPQSLLPPGLQHNWPPGAGETASPLYERPKQRSEEHTSELQSRPHLVCRLLLEKKNTNQLDTTSR